MSEVWTILLITPTMAFETKSIRYPVIAEPPFEVGAVQDKTSCPSPPTTPRPVGTPGEVAASATPATRTSVSAAKTTPTDRTRRHRTSGEATEARQDCHPGHDPKRGGSQGVAHPTNLGSSDGQPFRPIPGSTSQRSLS